MVTDPGRSPASLGVSVVLVSLLAVLGWSLSAGALGPTVPTGQQPGTTAPPEASFTVEPNPTVARTNTTLNATASFDSDGTIEEYRWDFDGDGTVDETTTSPTVVHQFEYRGDGFRIVRLTVVDDDGESDTTERDVRIRPKPIVRCSVSPREIGPGGEVVVDVSESEHADVYRYDFDGDGVDDTDQRTDPIVNSSEGFNEVYTEPGTYTPRVTARNTTADTVTVAECPSVTVVGENEPPAASFSVTPNPTVEGEETTLDASDSTDPDGTVEFYLWDFDGDGTVDLNTTDPVVTHAFDYDATGDGFAAVSLTVVDDDGATGRAERDVSIFRRDVDARCSVAPASTTVGDEVTLDASESSNGDVYRYDFDGDGTYDTDFRSDPVATVTYEEAGEYAPVVQVGNRTTDRVDVQECGVVQVGEPNEPPEPGFTWRPDPAVAGEETTLDAGDSIDPDGTVEEYRWDFDGDGTVDAVTTDPVTTYAFAYDETSEGVALVRLTVVDDDGATATVERDVPIRRATVTAQCTAVPDVVTVGEAVEVRVDPGSRVDAFQYDRDSTGEFGQFTEERVQSVSYDEPGTYTPRVRAWDTSTERSTIVECGTVTVEPNGSSDAGNTPPTAVLEYSPLRPDSGTNVTLDAANSTDHDGTVTAYRWDLDGDGTVDRVTNSSTITHTFDERGAHSVSVVVVDDDGATGSAGRTVSVGGGFACDFPFGLPCWTAIPGLVVPSAGGGMLLCRRLRDRRLPQIPRLPGGSDDGGGGISEYATGTFETPRDGGRLVVDGLGFEPDVLLFSATSGATPHRTDGWNYGRAVRHDDGSLTQNVVSVATDAGASDGTGGSVRTGQVLDLLVHDDESVAGLAGAVETTTQDGFEAVFDASSLPDGAAVQEYTVAYQAFSIPDGVDAAIGHTVAPADPGAQEIPLGIDADYLTLTATDATGGFETATMGPESVAVCHGTAVGDGANQQVQTSSVDPGDEMTGAFGAHTDRVLHLLDVADGTVRGRTSARVTNLGETLELTYDETDCVSGLGESPPGEGRSAGGHEGALITFVALDADAQAPEVGAVEFPSADAGTTQSVALGRQPGLVTFTTVPATERATDRVVTGNGLSFGWSHGTALRTGDGGVAQSVLQGTVDPDLVAKYGHLLTGAAGGAAHQGPGHTAAGGDASASVDGDAASRDGGPPTPDGGAASADGPSTGGAPDAPSLPPAVATVPALDESGATTGWDALGVTSFDDRGFTLAATSVSSPTRMQAGERPLVCYTAWPLLDGGDSGPK